jgi:hypothetical protein
MKSAPKNQIKIVSVPVDGINPFEQVPAVVLPGAPTSLSLPEQLTYQQWFSYGKYLRVIAQAGKWWLADWLARMDQYGHQGIQAVEDLEFPKHTLSNIKAGATVFRWSADVRI